MPDVEDFDKIKHWIQTKWIDIIKATICRNIPFHQEVLALGLWWMLNWVSNQVETGALGRRQPWNYFVIALRPRGGNYQKYPTEKQPRHGSNNSQNTLKQNWHFTGQRSNSGVSSECCLTPVSEAAHFKILFPKQFVDDKRGLNYQLFALRCCPRKEFKLVISCVKISLRTRAILFQFSLRPKFSLLRILFHPTELGIAFSRILIYPFSVPLSVKYLEWTSEICPNVDPSTPLCN